MPFDKSKFIEQFKAETLEHLQNLDLGLLKLEKNPDDKELLNSLMREAHTIKGSATMMGYKRIANIAHSMEDGLEKALKEGSGMGRTHFDILLKCVDSIAPLLEDKLTWEDKGVASPFADNLCSEVDAIFSGRMSESGPPRQAQETGQGIQRRKEAPQVRTTPEPSPEVRQVQTGSNDTSVRVDISRLNRLVNLSGEQLISKLRLGEIVKNISAKMESQKEAEEFFGDIIKDLRSASDNIDILASGIQTEVMNIRMVPVATLFNAFPRAMRTLAQEKGKEVEFVLRGSETTLDKSIIDEMRDPLMHILRNAIDHGIEDSEGRASRGKPRAGKIVLSAYQLGSQVVIEVSDDGRGIDVERIKEVAIAKGMASKDRISDIAEDQLLQIIFAPGFTTKNDVTDTSGRGVGLDVVREKVSNLKGMVNVSSKPGQGTRFTIKLPLTLAITGSLLVSAGDDIFAVPVERVVETIRISQQDIRSVETKEAISVRGHILPLIRMIDLFGLPKKGIMEKSFYPVVIVQSVEKRVGILVDRLLGHQEIVGKSIGEPLKKIKDIAGATILGNGRVVLILDIPSIIESSEDALTSRASQTDSEPKTRQGKKKTILLAEDALTTAMLEKNILESVGYSVVIARDGKEALDRSSQEKFDLVITDILMPRMDGFELTTRLKKDPMYKDIPIIIVTTRETAADKRRGLEAGADAYLLKSEFTSDILLDIIERLLG
ncbi:MAG: hybrid sensor histidine kinase/response regulator [Candidatus Omnitrophica bacterium]|nr:hybrid sensor histidine kinase/response regulator [Candidatus Omnitrophota bacterium]